MNRRGFFGRMAALIAVPFAAKVVRREEKFILQRQPQPWDPPGVWNKKSLVMSKLTFEANPMFVCMDKFKSPSHGVNDTKHITVTQFYGDGLSSDTVHTIEY